MTTLLNRPGVLAARAAMLASVPALGAPSFDRVVIVLSSALTGTAAGFPS
ncbi:hypothetical protein [Bradyrhizobium sp. AZCC 2289]